MRYTIRRAAPRPELQGLWDGPAWTRAETLDIAHFRPESSDHRPRAQARLLYDDEGIFGIFRVEDKYVRCVRTGYHSSVCRDSCVEFFVQPAGASGYFNFEFNCGGSLLLYYVTDPERTDDGLKGYIQVAEEDCRKVQIFHSLPERVEPEIQEGTEWRLEFFVPFGVLERYAGAVGKPAGTVWRGNLYKCGDETSHPHWASWAPVSEMNFHLPQCFGELQFEG